MENALVSLKGKTVYMVGIKGTGMAALAELLKNWGVLVSGSDVAEVFYTDAILEMESIPVVQGFSVNNIPDHCDLVIYSSAYKKETHEELIEIQKKGFPLLEYTEALGMVSESIPSSAVAGVHGKTTTTAMAGLICQGLGMLGSVLVGSAVSNFDGKATMIQGDSFFIAETCEYRRHFLRFNPKNMVITSIEPDHLDYFKDYDDIMDAFISFGLKLPERGSFIYCADEKGASEAAEKLKSMRADIKLLPYGFNIIDGDTFKIIQYRQEAGTQSWTIPLLEEIGMEFDLHIPGKHNVLNATAAFALVCEVYEQEVGPLTEEVLVQMADVVSGFKGTKRRSEVIYDGKITILDDYGHHPTAIKLTLEGLKEFYGGRRIVLDFMSHTFTRSKELLDEFRHCFDTADLLILHDIYPSAREKRPENFESEDFVKAIRENKHDLLYFPEIKGSGEKILPYLQEGDVFVTMGAGDNWHVAYDLADSYKK